MPFGTDQPLWYNNGVWGQLGYAVPNFASCPSTINSTIARLVEAVGKNLQAIMQHPDANLGTPPSINTLTRVHKLVLRVRTLLGARALPAAAPNMEPVHASPAEQVFIIYPCRYFLVRSSWLKEWAGLMLTAMAEAMQHSENARPLEVSQQFAGTVGQYAHRVYQLMATELFGIAADKAKALDFTLSDADLASYDPSKWFTSTEMVDVRPSLITIPTEEDLAVLAAGIPATALVGLQKWPSGLAAGSESPTAAGGAAAATGAGAAAAVSFAPPPGP